MKNVVILQNTPLGINKPLSIFLTGLLNYFKDGQKINLFLIVSSYSVKKYKEKNFKKIYETQTGLYSILGNIFYVIKSFFYLLKINRKNKINILHCFYPNSSLIVATLFKILLNKEVKIIYEVRSPWIEMIFLRKHLGKTFESAIKKPLHYLEKKLLNFVDYFIFISMGLQNYYSEKYQLIFKKNFEIIPTLVDLEIFKKQNSFLRKKLNIKDNEILIGQVGGIDESRDLLCFLKSFKLASKKQKHLKLLFIGDGNVKNKLIEYVNKNGLKKDVFFLNSMNHKKIPEIISGLDYGLCHLPDIFVYRYSVPIKIIEYLSCGIKVLASSIQAHLELKKKFDDNIIIYNSYLDLKKIKKNISQMKTPNKIIEYSYKYNHNKYLSIYHKL